MFKARKDIENRFVEANQTIKTTLECLNANNGGVLIVVDKAGKLRGTVTDGDIRRSLLKGRTLEDPVSQAMTLNPVIAHSDMDSNERMAVLMGGSVSCVPVVNDENEVLGIDMLQDTRAHEKLPNEAVIMCGGLGSRLGNLTRTCPKPMLRIGGTPILERILGNLIQSGVRRFFLATNYLREQIEEYFEDGSRWNVEIRYLREEQKLGTGGALSLLPYQPSHSLVVMNGDLLTNMSFVNMLKFHTQNGVSATMGIVEFQYTNPYGVIRHSNSKLVEIAEKPVSTCFINSGIYVIEPEMLEYVPKNKFMNMPDLLLQAKEKGHSIGVYPIYETWLDIGRPDDFSLAEKISVGIDNHRLY